MRIALSKLKKEQPGSNYIDRLEKISDTTKKEKTSRNYLKNRDEFEHQREYIINNTCKVVDLNGSDYISNNKRQTYQT